MKTIAIISALAVATFASAADAQIRITGAIGVVGRSSDAGSMSSNQTSGLAGEVGAAGDMSERVAVRLDLGGQMYPVTEATPGCVEGSECVPSRSLASGSHLIVSLESRLLERVVPVAIFGGAGFYRTATTGSSAAEGRRVASAVGLSGGASVELWRMAAEARLHVPVDDLAEVRWMLTALLRLRLMGR